MAFPYTVYLGSEEVTAETSDQRLPLATRGVTEDGRVFRYSQNGATALKAYMLCISPIEGPGSTATDQVFYSAYAAKTTYVKLALSTVTDLYAKNYLKDGWLVVNSTDVAYNQIVRIHSNEVLVSSTALGQLTGIWLYQPGLKKAVDTSTALGKLVPNKYRKVLVSTDANGPGIPLGITPLAVTASYYFWLQTWGETLIHAGEGISGSIDKKPGRPLFWSTGSTGGAAHAMTASASGFIAFDTDSGFAQAMGRIGCLVTAAPAANFFHVINLNLAP